ARTDLNVRPPFTCRGTLSRAVEPIPSLPLALSPQQYAAPRSVTAQVCTLPALIVANVKPPLTTRGTLSFFVVPIPSSPSALLPQQYVVPNVSPQLEYPVAIDMKT